jgi:methionine synthase II (cobalamin-independent)
MSTMIHLVGSVPFANSTEVFERVGSLFGSRLYYLPDGETGERLGWMGWLETIFADHPQFEKTGELFSPRDNSKEITNKYRLRAGVDPNEVRFDNLPQVRFAKDSYAEFERLKRAGTISRDVRFQVSLAGPISVIRRFLADECEQAAVQPAYEQGLIRAVEEMAASIPRDQLAIQWDVASAVFEALERGVPTRHGRTREEMMDSFVTRHACMGADVPRDVHLLFHLCYGDASHKHSIEPASATLLVEFANRISLEIGRTIELIHMPVPRNRTDDAYFEPLAHLKLRPETRLALGLVHYTDGVEGTRKRFDVAKKYVANFAIATECGFGRRSAETVPELLKIHAEVAGIKP